MPSSKSATPSVPPGHATEILKIGSPEEIAALAKLSPASLPNDALVASLQESHPDDPRWRLFRNDPNYVFVVNWLFQCRGYLRLASEHFDCDLFEIELFELVNPPPVDDMALFLNKLKLALISKVHGKKVQSLSMFETLFRVYFGSETPLSGPTEEEERAAEEAGLSAADASTGTYPAFDQLFIDEKLSILSMLITEVSQYPDFREFIDKNKLFPDSLRLPSVLKVPSRDRFRGEDYIEIFDGTALYKRIYTAGELVIPKKRKLAPTDPELHYPEESFDFASIEYQLIYKDVYGLDLFVKELKQNRKLKLNKALLDIIADPLSISNVFSYDIRKRKIIAGRRKEFEMARLLATRKRSSRIEAKEKQREVEEQEKKAQQLEDLKHASSRRSQRGHLQYQQYSRQDFTAGLSREQRLNLRKEKGADDTTSYPETASHAELSIPELNLPELSLPELSLSEPEVAQVENGDPATVSSSVSTEENSKQTPQPNSETTNSHGQSDEVKEALHAPSTDPVGVDNID